MPDESVLRLIFGTPIRPGGRTLGQILGRKVAKRTLRQALGISGTPDPGSKKRRKKRADVEEPNVVLAKMALLNFVAKAASIEKEAPFKSQAQRRKFYAMKSRGEISAKTVKKWEEHTPKGKLPERVHRKAAEEKEAFWGTVASVGSKVFKATAPVVSKALTPVKHVAKSMIFPTTGMQMYGTGPAAWSAVGGIQAGRQGPGFRMQPMQPRIAALADALLAMTKESFEIRDHSPASTDVAEPIVKKNSMSKSSAAGGFSPGMGVLPVKPASIKGLSSPTVNPGTNWLGNSSTMGAKWSNPARPDVRKPAGIAGEEMKPPAQATTHIQRAGA